MKLPYLIIAILAVMAFWIGQLLIENRELKHQNIGIVAE